MRLLLLICMSFFIQPAISQKQGYVIDGLINGVKSGKMYLLRFNPSELIDSTDILDGKFIFKGKVDEPFIVEMLTDETDYVEVFCLENNPIKISINKEPYSSKINGGQNEQLVQDLLKSLQHLYDSIWKIRKELSAIDSASLLLVKPRSDSAIRKFQGEINRVNEQFILEHPDSYVTPGRILMLFRHNQKMLEKHYSLLSDRIQKSREGLNIVDRINELKNSPVVGGKAKGFTLADPDSKRYSIQKLNKGKYLLIDFWASWCGPCIEEFPYLRQAYERFQKQGFQIVGISIDKDRTAWIKSLSTHKLAWLQLLDEKVKGTSVQGKYSVRSIPSNFLIDNEMKIVAINLRGEKLLKTLEELLKEE